MPAPPIGGHLVQLFSFLQKRFRPSDPDMMTNTAFKQSLRRAAKIIVKENSRRTMGPVALIAGASRSEFGMGVR